MSTGKQVYFVRIPVHIVIGKGYLEARVIGKSGEKRIYSVDMIQC
jgi:hypothetical protein